MDEIIFNMWNPCEFDREDFADYAWKYSMSDYELLTLQEEDEIAKEEKL